MTAADALDGVEFGPSGPAPGVFPHRFTQDDRFQYRVKIQPVAGHLEFYIRPVDTRLPAMAAERAFLGHPIRQFKPEQDPADRLDNQLKATQRAQRKIRLLCMEAGVDRLFTFTTRGMLTRDQLLKAWDGFRRVMERNYKNFRYVATIENHKSGQLHIHAGLSGFHNINHLRRIWQTCLNRCLGRDQSLVHGADSPGTVNIPPSRKRREGVRGSMAISSYVAKYVGKGPCTDFNRKRYMHTKNIKIQVPKSLWLDAANLFDAVMETARAYGFGHLLKDLKPFKSAAFIRVCVDDLLPPPF
jgi:hypothetical protein